MHWIKTDHQFTRRKRVHVVFDGNDNAVFIDRSLWRCLLYLIENDVHYCKIADDERALLVTLKRDQGSHSSETPAKVPEPKPRKEV